MQSRTRLWLVATVLVAACMAAAGFWVGRGGAKSAATGPRTQAVIDFLAKPLPVPANAKQVAFFRLSSGVGEGTVNFTRAVALDVTGLTKDDINGIPNTYASHFAREFEFGNSGGGSDDLAKFGPDDFGLAVGSYWTQNRKLRYEGRHFDLNIEAELMDFEPVRPGVFPRLPVRHLDDPVRGQRVMWVRITFRGRDLVGPGKWPQ